MLMFSEAKFMPRAGASVLFTCPLQQGPVLRIALLFSKHLLERPASDKAVTYATYAYPWHRKTLSFFTVSCLVSATLNPTVKVL